MLRLKLNHGSKRGYRPQCSSVLMPYLPPASTETLISSFLEIWFLQKQKCVYGKWKYNQLGSYSIIANGVKPTRVVKAQIVQDVLGYLCNILNFRWHFRRKSLPQLKISSVLKHVLLPAISKLQTNLFIICWIMHQNTGGNCSVHGIKNHKAHQFDWGQWFLYQQNV